MFHRERALGVRRPFQISEEREKRSSEVEKLFARVFNTEDGKKVLSILANETAGMVVSAEASVAVLQRMEGKRELVADIIERVQKGMTR